MNARSQTFEFAVEGRQIDEVVSCMFHTILFHRCVGKVCLFFPLANLNSRV